MSEQRGLLELRTDHYGLSILRIGFFLVAFADFFQLYLNRGSSYELGSYVGAYLVPLCLLGLLCLAAGLWTRASALASVVLVQIVMHATEDHYHFDYSVMCFAFIFLFAPAPRVWSLDSYLAARRGAPREPTRLPVAFSAIILLAMTLVYYDSVVHKLRSDLWCEGLAFWLPAAIPNYSTGLYPEFAEVDWMVRVLSFTALALEIGFPLLIVRPLKAPILLVGIGLHIGIALFFPIPFFGIGVCALYLFYVDWGSWLRAEPLPPQPPSPRLRKAWFAIAALFIMGQSVRIVCRSYPESARLKAFEDRLHPYLNLMGIYPHPLYLDWHFSMTAPLLRFETEVDGRWVEIPCFDREGYTQRTGRYWAVVNFLLREQYELESPDYRFSKRYLEGWFYHQGLEPRDVRVFYKDARIDLALDFEQNNRIIEAPWKPAGWFRYEGGAFRQDWTERFERERRDTWTLVSAAAAALPKVPGACAIEVRRAEEHPVFFGRVFAPAEGPLPEAVAVISSGLVEAELKVYWSGRRGTFESPSLPHREEGLALVRREGVKKFLAEPVHAGPSVYQLSAGELVRSGLLRYTIAEGSGGEFSLTRPSALRGWACDVEGRTRAERAVFFVGERFILDLALTRPRPDLYRRFRELPRDFRRRVLSNAGFEVALPTEAATGELRGFALLEDGRALVLDRVADGP